MSRHALDLDEAVVRRLLPHRSPMALVDRVIELLRGSHPTLRAELSVDPEHPALAGHFPGRPIWPGVLTIEGLAQVAGLLLAIETVVEAAPDVAGGLASLGDAASPPPAGTPLLVRADVKLTRPVRPGDRLDYRATHLRTRLGMAQCEVEAHVQGRRAATGVVTVAWR